METLAQGQRKYSDGILSGCQKQQPHPLFPCAGETLTFQLFLEERAPGAITESGTKWQEEHSSEQ